MDKCINQSTTARREAFGASFEIDAEAQGKIDALFAEIEKLGAECKDVEEFETEFAKSPLNQRYLDLFTEIATKGVAKNTAKGAEFANDLATDEGYADDLVADAKKDAATSVVKSAAVGVAQSAAEQAFQNAVPTTRAAVHQKAYDAARSVPGLGDAIDIAEKASYAAHLGKLFRKKKN